MKFSFDMNYVGLRPDLLTELSASVFSPLPSSFDVITVQFELPVSVDIMAFLFISFRVVNFCGYVLQKWQMSTSLLVAEEQI